MDTYCVRERPMPEVFVSIAAGSRHTCGLLADGRARCWGRETSLYPFKGNASSLASSNFVEIDSQGDNNCGLRANGGIHCWDEVRNLPGGYLTGLDQPTPPFEQETYQAIATAVSHVCALDGDNRIRCWGRYYWDWEEPNTADWLDESADSQFLAINAGTAHVCGLRDDKRVLCWGNNDTGQLDAPTEQSFVHIAAGAGHTCALKTDGAAVCWGDDSYGQSTPPAEARFSSLSAGGLHTCGLQPEGTALCWGSDIDGQVSPPRGVVFAEISAGSQHSCGLTTTGEALCWGSDAYGQSTPPPALAHFSRLFTDWNARGSHGPVLSCGLRADGLAQCWGAGHDPTAPVHGGARFAEIAIGNDLTCGLLLDGHATCWRHYANYSEPRLDAVVDNIPDELTFSTLVIVADRACGLTSERFIHCWGANQNWLSQDLPPPPSGKHIAIATSEYFACAINDAGRIKCWDNAYGLPEELEQIVHPYRGTTSIGEHFGRNESLDRKYRALALSDGAWYSSGGSEDRTRHHACALLEDQSAVCWGADEFGQSSPPSGVRFRSITAGGKHSCGVTLEGLTRCWGADNAGQSTPPTSEALSDLQADHDSTCGLRADGSVVCWGHHNYSAPAQLVPFDVNLPRWHSADVLELDQLGVIAGTECTTQRFCTDAPLSRATLAVWLDRLIGADLPAVAQDAATPKHRGDPLGAAKLSRTTVAQYAATLKPWDDVAADVWWADHAQRLVAADVMRPCDSAARTFCPDEPVTRGELNLSLQRALHVRNDSDQQARSSVAVAHTVAAVGADVLSMCIDRSPERCRQGAMTRGQAATVLNRFRLHLRRLDRPVFTSASGANGGGCGSRSDGSVECWGHDSTGVTYVPSNARVLDVHWDGTMWCGLRVDHYLICGGWDGGYGHTHVAASVSLSQRAEASIGLSHSCGLLADRSLECIVASSIGTRGPVHDWNVPEGEFTAVAVGGGRSCGLRLDGSPVCWSSDMYGEDEDEYGVRSPPQGARYSAIALGSRHSCGLRADGTPECWGYGGDGRLTPPTTAHGVEETDDADYEPTTEPSPLTFKDIAAGSSFTCGLTRDGLVACWGDLGGAQPPEDVRGQEFASITAVGNYVCVERPNGSTRCWGSGRFRRSLDNDAGFIEVSANEELTCGRRTDGTVQCWGGEYQDLPSNTPERLSFTSLTTGSSFACGRTEVGTQRCWSLDAERDVPVGATDEDIVQFSDSGHLLCALGSAGEVTCSDRSDGGETMPRGGDYVQVATGAVSEYWRGERRHVGHACAVDTSGSIRCWGDNSVDQSTPPAGNDFVKVAASGVHACGLRTDGRIECWGQGLRHDEGPSSTQRYSDVVVGAGGGYWGTYEDDEGRITYPAHACGLRVDGVVDCWGSVYTPNKPYNRHEPDPRSRFTSISSGRGHVCGVRTDGAIECWGIPGFIAY
ncbi:hypothetical protein [Candidatus Poriferisodalis sp.]|uniref:hypothetical protein n=1 Tax=Candidatus Poriferisodalis sp. TaxID=3101277 RepID=UPI003B01FC9C